MAILIDEELSVVGLSRATLIERLVVERRLDPTFAEEVVLDRLAPPDH